MINNSSLGKWDRLAHKQLDQQFTHEVVQGLQCSPFEADALLDTVHRVYGMHFQTSGALKPGQLPFQVVAAHAPASRPLAECAQVTVMLTLDAGQEDLDLRRTQGVQALRRHRMERMCHEAFQQGGLLTVEDLANRLFNCGQRTLARDLKVLRAQGVVLPLRSTIKDMGRSITHRSLIVQEWLRGKEYSEIASSTHHSVPSVQNYVSKFKRIVALAQEGHDVHTLAFLIKVSPGLVEAYYELYRTMDMAPHRREELLRLAKKKDRRAPAPAHPS